MKQILPLLALVLLLASCDMNKQTRATPPSKPKTRVTATTSQQDKATVSKTSTTQKSVIDQVKEFFSPGTAKKSKKTSSTPSWQIPFAVQRIKPSTAVFTITGGALLIHFLLKTLKK